VRSFPLVACAHLTVPFSFVNWGIYGRKYLPQYIPANDLTHILYSFAKIDPSSGTVGLTDEWADKDIHYPGDSWNTPDGETHLFGNFKVLYELKKKHRHLKTIMSIGGWGHSAQFHSVVVDEEKRAVFVKTAVGLVDDYGLDGLDVDYEYPENAEHAQGYVDLLRELREALDQREKEYGDGCKLLLTVRALLSFHCL
jgi:chitinase